MLSQLTLEYPAIPTYRQEAANACNGLAAVLAAQGQWSPAGAAWREAIESLERLHALGKGSATSRADLGMCLGNLGRLHLKQDEFSQAETYLLRGLAEMNVAISDDPDRVSYRQAIYNQCADLAKVLIRQGRFEEVLSQASDLSLQLKNPLVNLPARLVFLDSCLRDLESTQFLAPAEQATWRQRYLAIGGSLYQESTSRVELAEFVTSSSRLAKLRESLASPGK
jgi:tetratricopeptide (TPR) repeat protein